ncbi:hypothetical protein TUMSATVNIG1_56620 (plasmid) [Vibrio nigripulchritudo]|nr:hypothetical protein TUMSATVNIG1_56620 [Vibrio nigripulchritudo]
MEWWQIFIVILGSLITLMMLGLPVAFSFLVVNIVWCLHFYGANRGYRATGLQNRRCFNKLYAFTDCIVYDHG